MVVENTIPYWPRMNGLVERFNRDIKASIDRSLNQRTDWWNDLLVFLQMYRSTPHTVTGRSPAYLMYGREIRTKIPGASEAIKELDDDFDVLDKDRVSKEMGRKYGDKRAQAKSKNIKVGDKVLIKTMKPGTKWSPKYVKVVAVVTKAEGDSIWLETASGAKYNRNAAHLLPVNDFPDEQLKQMMQEDCSSDEEEEITQTSVPVEKRQVDDITTSSTEEITEEGEATLFDPPATNASTPLVKRARRAPAWHQDYQVNKIDDQSQVNDS